MRWSALRALLVLGAATAAATAAAGDGQALVQAIFGADDLPAEQYEIKSCLSPELEAHEHSSCLFFAVIIDAGSTGTRLHLFEFSHDVSRPQSPFRLEREVFEEVKPGLSAFGADAAAAARSLAPLLARAQATVPRNQWPHTPIALKATAGLRALPAKQADAIVARASELLAASGFLSSADSVAVMSGVDEGVFGWFTLNFLLDRLDAVLRRPLQLAQAVDARLTAAALDLGGGSTQITFRPLQAATARFSPADFLLHISIFGQEVELYTHSYLGNGLVAARHAILNMSTRPSDKLPNSLYSSCVPPGYRFQWNYTEQFVVSGCKSYGLEQCLAEVDAFVAASRVHAPLELRQRDLFAFSYFFDRALQAALVGDTRGATVRVDGFLDAARLACGRNTAQIGKEHWRPWQCLDLAYIYSLLTKGYGLPPDKHITLTKKLRDMEVSWALGAAYHLLNTYHEERSRQREGRSLSRLGAFVCSRLYAGLTHVLGVFQLVA